MTAAVPSTALVTALAQLASVHTELDTHRFLLTCEPTAASWLVRTALAGRPATGQDRRLGRGRHCPQQPRA
jgi:hypothetical protein